MVLKVLYKCLLDTDRLEALTTSLGSCNCLSAHTVQITLTTDCTQHLMFPLWMDQIFFPFSFQSCFFPPSGFNLLFRDLFFVFFFSKAVSDGDPVTLLTYFSSARWHSRKWQLHSWLILHNFTFQPFFLTMNFSERLKSSIESMVFPKSNLPSYF